MDMELLHGYGAKPNEVLDQIVDSYIVSADGNLNAGDLCEFINGQIRKTSYTTTSSIDNQVNSIYSASFVSSTPISSTQALLAYIGNVSNSYLYVVVLTINGASISIGTPTQITSVSTSFPNLSVLNSTTIVISYLPGTTYVYSNILTISGSTISVGSQTQISTIIGYYIESLVLNSNQILLTYMNASSSPYQTMGVILTISGSSISIGAATQITNMRQAVSTLTKLSATSALIIFRDNSSSYLWAVAISISGTNITAGATVEVYGATANWLTLVTLSTTQAVAVWQGASSYLQAVSIIVSGTTIVLGTVTQVVNAVTAYTASVAVNSNQVIAFYVNSSNYLAAVMLTIAAGGILTNGSPIVLVSLNTYQLQAMLIDSQHVLLSYQIDLSTCYVYSRIIGIDNLVNPSLTVVTHNKQPNVLALTSGTSGNTIKCGLKGIIKPNINFTSGVTYYCDDSGKLVVIPTRAGEKPIGVSLSDTELLINKGFWER